MTKEQMQELARVDSEHFELFEEDGFTGLLVLDGPYDGVLCTVKDFHSVYWWMLNQLPEGTDLGWQENINKFACRVRTKEGWDVGMSGVRGFGDTREAALIDAYIEWKKATKT